LGLGHSVVVNVGVMSNPLQEDPELKKLLQDLRSIEDGSEFLKWRKTFLELYENYLDSRGTEIAYEAYKQFGRDLRGFNANILQLESFVKSGDLSTETCTVKARQSMSELQLKLAAVMHELMQLCPSTSEEERRKGHTKFEMGAILVRDGFSDYGRLEAAGKVMNMLSKGAMGQMADKQLLVQMDKFRETLQRFTDIMEDLGLFSLMQKSQQFKNCPVEPPKMSMNRSTPYENTHTQEEPIARAPPKRTESADRFEVHIAEPTRKKRPPASNTVSDDEEDKPAPKRDPMYGLQNYYHGNTDDWRNVGKKPPPRAQSVPPPQRPPQHRSTPYAISNPSRGREPVDRPTQQPASESSESSDSSISEDTPEQLAQIPPQQTPVEKQAQAKEPAPRKRWFNKFGRDKPQKAENQRQRAQSVPPQRTREPLARAEKKPSAPPPERLESSPRLANVRPEKTPQELNQAKSTPTDKQEPQPKPRKGWFGRGRDKQNKQETKRAQSVPPERSHRQQQPRAPQPPPNNPQPMNESPESAQHQPITDDPTPEDSTIADSTKVESQAPVNQSNSVEELADQDDEDGEGDGEEQMYTAAVVDFAGSPLRLEERPIPTPGKGEVLIRVIACGVCHADSYTQNGTFPGVGFPRVPGHEYTGWVVSVGPEVEWPLPRALVGVGWHGGHCLVCKICRSGNFTMCEKVNITGVHVDGGYQEYALAHWTGVIELPKRFDPLRDAPLLGAAVGLFRALQKETDARPGDIVAIQGIGGIGHIGIQLARKMGYRVIAISNSNDKEEDALEMGAHLFIGPKTKSVTRKLQKLGGAKLIVSTAPTSQVLGALVPGLGLNGRLVTMGISAGKFGLSPNNLIFNHGTIIGVTPGKPYDAEELAEFAILQDVECRTEIFPLEDAQKAFDRMISGNAHYRVVLKIADRE